MCLMLSFLEISVGFHNELWTLSRLQRAVGRKEKCLLLQAQLSGGWGVWIYSLG